MENKKALGIGVVGCGSTGIQSVLQHTCEEDKGNLVYTASRNIIPTMTNCSRTPTLTL